MSAVTHAPSTSMAEAACGAPGPVERYNASCKACDVLTSGATLPTIQDYLHRGETVVIAEPDEPDVNGVVGHVYWQPFDDTARAWVDGEMVGVTLEHYVLVMADGTERHAARSYRVIHFPSALGSGITTPT